LQADIPVDSFVMSKFGLGLDNMLRSYLIDEVSNLEMEDAFKTYQLGCAQRKICNRLFRKLEKIIESDKMHKGITATAGGFTDLKGAFCA
jgi:uridine phosphorylase